MLGRVKRLLLRLSAGTYHLTASENQGRSFGLSDSHNCSGEPFRSVLNILSLLGYLLQVQRTLKIRSRYYVLKFRHIWISLSYRLVIHCGDVLWNGCNLILLISLSAYQTLIVLIRADSCLNRL